MASDEPKFHHPTHGHRRRIVDPMTVPGEVEAAYVRTHSAVIYDTHGGAAETLTGDKNLEVESVLSGVKVYNTGSGSGESSITLPSATVIQQQIPGIKVGFCFELTFINVGSDNLTITLGPGCTAYGDGLVTTGAGGVRLLFYCTNVGTPGFVVLSTLSQLSA